GSAGFSNRRQSERRARHRQALRGGARPGFLAEPTQLGACLPRDDAGGAWMTRENALRKGWCPGARRPMQARDGLLVRLRISGGIVTAAALRGLAQAGRAHGNGLFDLSARANL